MDPRLKAYQKQTRPAAIEAPEPPPVVRTPQLPRFQNPVEPEKAPLVKTTVKGLGDKSLRKVAKFLILLGQDEAAKVVRHLDPSQIEALGHEIAGIKTIESVEAEALLKEFGYIATQQTKKVKGGRETAKAILNQAFGNDKAKTILKKAAPHASDKPFAFFQAMAPEVVLALLGPESTQVLSVVVPFLEKAQAAAFLKALDPARRLDLVKRLAKMESVPSPIVAQVEQSLSQRYHDLTPANTESVDGKARLADILRHMSVGQEASILRALDGTKPELTEDLRRRLFTETDLVRVSDAGFEDLLRAKEDPQVALLWLAGDAALRTKIEANLSSRRLLLVKAEIDLMADTSLRELQKELRFFLDEVRQAVRDGRAMLLDDTEDYI